MTANSANRLPDEGRVHTLKQLAKCKEVILKQMKRVQRIATVSLLYIMEHSISL